MQNTRILTAAMAVLLAAASVPTGCFAAGLCGAGETTYFSCLTARHRAVALCGHVPSTLQYRFGKAARVELAFPADAAEGVRQLLYAHYARYQVERSEVTFSHAGVDYAVFDYTGPAGRHAGVQVTRTDGVVHEVACSGAIAGRLGVLGASLRCDTDSALNGGRCP